MPRSLLIVKRWKIGRCEDVKLRKGREAERPGGEKAESSPVEYAPLSFSKNSTGQAKVEGER